MSEITTTKLAVFKGKKIRKVVYKNEWWFSVVDVIAVLGISIDARNYWKVLKNRLEKEGSNQTVTNCNQLKLLAADGKLRKTDCASTETMLRIIQSVPSKRAEPLKLWLAKVGYERIQEIEDPELATKRTKEIYKAKGYPNVWIEKRMRGIAIREELTDEWRKREAKGEREYAILTAEISKATFGMTPSVYKKYKGLNKENLRDHMTDLELILNMLGEATTTKLTKDRDSMGFKKLKVDAHDGGSVAGRTRKDIEKQSGKRVVTKQNYLPKNTVKKLGSL